MMFLRWGKRYKHGRGGVKPNLGKALDSFLKGAARGSTLAMVDAELVYWEMGDKEKGIALYRKAAELGDPAGQCNLGISYLQAAPPCYNEAVKWLYKASLSGHVRAQYQLALCLHQGHGLPQNFKEAARWYQQAAVGGYARAMYNASLCYSGGVGFPQSHQLARKWMKRAADCGHIRAQFEHGLALVAEGGYDEGCGISRVSWSWWGDICCSCEKRCTSADVLIFPVNKPCETWIIGVPCLHLTELCGDATLFDC